MDIAVKVVAMVVGIALIAMGCAVYALAELGVGPYIAATLALHENSKHPSLKISSSSMRAVSLSPQFLGHGQRLDQLSL